MTLQEALAWLGPALTSAVDGWTQLHTRTLTARSFGLPTLLSRGFLPFFFSNFKLFVLYWGIGDEQSCGSF